MTDVRVPFPPQWPADKLGIRGRSNETAGRARGHAFKHARAQGKHEYIESHCLSASLARWLGDSVWDGHMTYCMICTNLLIFHTRHSTNVIRYIGSDARPSWRDHQWRTNISLRGCWTLAVPSEMFISSIGLLKGLQCSLRKRRRKSKRERWREGRSGAHGDVIWGSEIPSEPRTGSHCELLVAWPETISVHL